MVIEKLALVVAAADAEAIVALERALCDKLPLLQTLSVAEAVKLAEVEEAGLKLAETVPETVAIADVLREEAAVPEMVGVALALAQLLLLALLLKDAAELRVLVLLPDADPLSMREGEPLPLSRSAEALTEALREASRDAEDEGENCAVPELRADALALKDAERVATELGVSVAETLGEREGFVLLLEQGDTETLLDAEGQADSEARSVADVVNTALPVPPPTLEEVPLTVPRPPTVPEPLREGSSDGVKVAHPVDVVLAERDAEAQGEAEWEEEEEYMLLALTITDMLGLALPVELRQGDGVPLSVRTTVSEAVVQGEAEPEAVSRELSVAWLETVAEAVCAGERDVEEEAEAEGVAQPVEDTPVLVEAQGEADTEAVTERENVPQPLPLGVGVMLKDGKTLTDPQSLGEAVTAKGLPVAHIEGLTVEESVCVPTGLGVVEPQVLAVGVGLRPDAEGEDEPEAQPEEDREEEPQSEALVLTVVVPEGNSALGVRQPEIVGVALEQTEALNVTVPLGQALAVEERLGEGVLQPQDVALALAEGESDSARLALELLEAVALGEEVKSADAVRTRLGVAELLVHSEGAPLAVACSGEGEEVAEAQGEALLVAEGVMEAELQRVAASGGEGEPLPEDVLQPESEASGDRVAPLPKEAEALGQGDCEIKGVALAQPLLLSKGEREILRVGLTVAEVHAREERVEESVELEQADVLLV